MAAPPAMTLVTTNLGLFSALSAIKPDSTEVPVSILWTNICLTFFPMDSFKISKKETVAVVFQVRLRHPQVVHPNSSSDLEERQIFIVECKRPSKDTPAEWEATAGQLSHYCEQNLTGSTKIFGATAIGTKVKFWRYSIPNLTELHGGVYDLSDQSGRDNTEQSLLYIRDNGWAWTASG
ncbi:hypothetical protein DTO166G4_3626 [Paecilomyces variotii]|nr:hypothetical protein DTO166G4_3626 [Paecilomyces variotii]KAJ9222910.1 hypothetical protein DTO169C6_4759 [Paecilomyces variotii]KAJ9237462.1 hypothetical protein DTO166G5_3552 [Paecilomyces variotii]